MNLPRSPKNLFTSVNTSEYMPSISEESLSDEQVLTEIHALKKELKDKVIFLGHHYQQDDIIQFADIRGDSLMLAKKAGELDLPYIIFCGVHFMAETADMLTTDQQHVILPDLNAGCSMADMANLDQLEESWDFIKSKTDEKIIPVTYINCSAELKAFVGKHGGSICTSSNAKEVIEWALNKGDKLFFFPDQHLGRNTCFDMGIHLEQMSVYDPLKQNGGLSSKDILNSKVLLWYGFCSVHQGFKTEHIENIRQISPQAKIIVHPECSFDVVQKSDHSGSTSFIINYIDQAAKGSEIAVGTEINLVNRLAAEYPDKKIYSLSPYQCLCTTMYRVRPRWLLASLRSIKSGSPQNIIKVSSQIKADALKALDTMLKLS